MTTIAEVLAEHQYEWGTGQCSCGNHGAPDSRHRAHVTEALQPLIDAEKRAAVEEARGSVDAAIERASRVFGWQHLVRYSGQSQDWMGRTLGAIVRNALAAEDA